ncbi:PAS domain S-box protein [Pseudodesulfovibrio sp.]|uniref:PAS domain S-box protein n=1 Tax=Pseudodesulfovibrio sp. TaxID=2035812 RepID=UPI002631E718|nr:PAS domain S-box protein [Pseudodesulfovibrio sp.]MDD3311298.1 PAS domain S-box protein [Pseudodesulfovibrio sp.]
MTNTTKEFIKVFGPLSLGIVLIAAWFILSRTQSHVEEISQRQIAMVGQASRFVTDSVVTRLADTRFLARATAHALERRGGVDFAELKNVFADFSASRPSYFQARYLNGAGMEIIRVDQYQNGPELTPDQALQDKSDRYYFKEAMRGAPDDVYISELDLNVEHGKLETPLRPTLRIASPVIGHDGDRLGVVVLNLDASTLLAQVTQLASTPEASTMFCNTTGHWFIAPAAEDAWGHLLEHINATMEKRFPEAWAQILGSSQGQVRTRNGLFTYDTVRITPNSIVPRGVEISDPGDKGWRIITLVSPEELALPWRNLFLLLTAVGMVALGLGLWHFINFRMREFEAEARIRESEERTLAITRSSRDAIVLVDEKDRVTYWNPAGKTLFGYDSREALNRPLSEFLTPAPLSTMADATSESGPRVTEFEAHNKEGAPLPVELSTSRFKHLGQTYTVGFMRDITRRKQRETALKRSEETARALLNAPTESALLIDRAGTILAINEIGSKRLCGEGARAVGQPLFKLIDEGAGDLYRNAINWVVSTGESTEFEILSRERRILVNAYPVLGELRGVENIAIFARDVTEQYQAQAALRQSEQRFRDISEAVGEFIWETDADMNFTFVTDDSAFVLGYTPEELLGRPMEMILPAAFQSDFRIWQAQVMGGHRQFCNVEMQTQTKDGSLIWLRISGVPYFDEGAFRGYRGAAMNITESKQQQEDIKASERKLRALAESAYDAIVMTDNLGRISFWNHAAEKLFGYREDEALGREVHSLISPLDRTMEGGTGLPPLSMSGKRSAVGDISEVEGMNKAGRRIPLELSVAGFRLNDRWFAVATIRDITERKATETKLRELATTDALTGLNNRRWFMELATAEFARSRRYNRALAMFMMDIDHFKRVNDTYGHDVGDQVLSSLAGIAVGALREADILGRLGGEEFGVLLPETSRQSALDVAERLRAAVENAILRTNAGELRITVSLGVAVMGGTTSSVDGLLKEADVALYQAKENGRNRVFTS